jgi:hypothetical protein
LKGKGKGRRGMLLVLSLLAWIAIALALAVGVRRWFFAVPPDGRGGEREVRIAVVGKFNPFRLRKSKGKMDEETMGI